MIESPPSLGVGEGGNALAPLVCEHCQHTLAPDKDVLSADELLVVREHYRHCGARKEWYYRRRRNLDPGVWASSYSAMSSYEDCPASYKYAQDSPDRFSNTKTELGNVVHDYYSSKHTGKDFDLARLPLSEGDDYEFLKKVLDEHEPPEDSFFEASMLIHFPLADGRTAEIRAKIDVLSVDVLSGVAYVTDWKSGRKRQLNHWATQRKMYALAVLRNVPGIWKVCARTVELRTGAEFPKRGAWHVMTAAEIEVFALHLQDRCNEMASDQEFKPQPELTACRLCDFNHKCPAGQRLLEPFTFQLKALNPPPKAPKAKKGEEPPPPPAPVETIYKIEVPAQIGSDPKALHDLALSAIQLEALLDGIKKTLKAAGGADIPEIGTAYRGWISKSKRVTDVGAYLQKLIEKGIGLEEGGIAVNHQRAHWLLEKDPELAALAHEVEDRYARWEFRKYKEEPAE